MNIIISSRKVHVKDNFKERVNKKLSKFDRIFNIDTKAEVIVTVEKKYQTVEITIRHNGLVYRAESSKPEMNEALDNVVDMLSRQIRKNKTKLIKKIKSDSLSKYLSNEPIEEKEEESNYNIVKSKKFPIKPLDIEEAILQMNLIHHQFYMFRNIESGEINLIYKRKNGSYGLIEPNDK